MDKESVKIITDGAVKICKIIFWGWFVGCFFGSPFPSRVIERVYYRDDSNDANDGENKEEN